MLVSGRLDSLSELIGLEGRVACVTGTSGVLGGAIARGLAAASARVATRGTPARAAGGSRGDPPFPERGKNGKVRCSSSVAETAAKNGRFSLSDWQSSPG
jgi:NAD(P)-dependent dehydrogenase (short-subunit alcohol dehydrogenase family)